MRFTQSFMDEIRDRVPISDVVGLRVTWDKKKSNASRGDFWACCPFHGEKTPSFHCEDKKGRYYCFGCGVSGDHFRFMTDLDGITFPEAVERVAGMAGIAMPAPDPEAREREEKRATLYDVMEMAAQFFQEQLQTQAGANARTYLRDRGLKASTLDSFRLGYAPSSRKALKEHLASKGATREQIEACGLVVHGDGIPVSYDRFRDRIMFPIEDAQGRVIAFGGRALSADVPAKYLNSPETELFHKSDILYNFKRARAAAARAKDDPAAATLIAVEGYMDVIALAQAGFANAVAPLGTALTDRQMELLWRSTPEPVLCFDGDDAGLRAAFRSLDIALPGLKPGKSVRFALLPQGQDPDDLVRAEGPQAFADIIGQARSLAELLWMRETNGRTFDTPERRAQLEAQLRDVTSAIADESVRRHYQQDMRERTRSFFGAPAPGKSGFGGARQGRGPHGAGRGRFSVSEQLTGSALVSGDQRARLPLRECALIATLINHPVLLSEMFDTVIGLELGHAGLQRLRSAIMQAAGETLLKKRRDLVDHPAMLPVRALIDEVDRTVTRSRLWVVTEDAAIEDVREGFRQAVTLHRRARSLSRELKSAERNLADDMSETNLARLNDIKSQMARVQSLEALMEGFGQSSGRPVRSF